MARTKSSQRWLKEHFSDHYVKRAQKEGFRSRAVYKLWEIQEKDHLFKPGMTVVDLGAAPGSWAQLLAQLVGKRGKVIALDILPIEPLVGVECIQGDFSDDSILQKLFKHIEGSKVDIVVSDMSPNLSGCAAIDAPRSMYLAELALDFAKQVLQPESQFLVKAFQGEGFDEFLKQLRLAFKQVVIRKPKASRSRSPEIYLLAKGYRKTNL